MDDLLDLVFVGLRGQGLSLGCTAAHTSQDEHVEEVHSAQDEQDDANFAALQLDYLAKVRKGCFSF